MKKAIAGPALTTELNIVNLFCGMGGDELGIRWTGPSRPSRPTIGRAW